jgi:hypothetical protein
MILTHAQKAAAIVALTEMYAQARENYWACAEHLSEALAGYPSMDMLEPDQVRERLKEIIR